MSEQYDIFDREFESCIYKEKKLEIVSQGFRFIEGPAWDAQNNRLFFNDIKGNAIYTWSESKGLEVFRDNSYMANGNTFDNEGNLITCEHAASRISLTKPNGEYIVLIDSYKGRQLNSPNDVIVSSDGTIIFTDPASGRSPGFGVPRPQELDFQGVFALKPGNTELDLLINDFEMPNGLCLSPDETLLYVNDTKKQHIRVFDFNKTRITSSGRIFAEFTQDLPGKADGMKIDSFGRIYCTGPGGILVFTQTGKPIGRILIPEQTANFTWGGKDLKTLYITASSTLYSLEIK
ncbi:MAG: SMP-30/gluconolactonase/LRE family protein [Spirochaetia bacterium]|nr:SMP-30/gluconolactonase/LRE family protein [Spirochaetia bacterium]